MNTPPIIVIEGNIATGKTSIGYLMQRFMTLQGRESAFLVEPIGLEDPMLKLFLSDMKKYSFCFQMWVAQLRVNLYKEAVNLAANGYVVIIDRSLRGDMAFEAHHWEAGNISDEEHATYVSYITDNLKGLPEPNYTLHVKAPIEDILSRISKRNRLSEQDAYSKEYLLEMEACHGKTLKEVKTLEFLNVDSEVLSNPSSAEDSEVIAFASKILTELGASL